MKLNEKIKCPECNGSGEVFNDTAPHCNQPPSNCCGGCGDYVECNVCDGEGEIRFSRYIELGFAEECPMCDNVCEHCDYTGWMPEEIHL